MNALSETFARAGAMAPHVASASPLRRQYDGFKVLANTRSQPLGQLDALGLEGARDLALLHCSHKDTFLVREHDPIARTTVAHFYAVKRKSAARYAIIDHVPTRVHDHYAEHLFSMAVAAIVPVEPWKWEPGADAVGRDADVIDQPITKKEGAHVE